MERLSGVFEVEYTPWVPETEYKRIKGECDIKFNSDIEGYMNTPL